MAGKGHKTIKIIFASFIFLIVGGFLVNWYMTYRIESLLNQRLSQEISKATGGFYHFTFNKLSIGLFSGELSIKEIELIPDSTVFLQWKKGDSLPAVYFKIHIGEIHFKGTNLTWKKDYKKLSFTLFEVNSPDIKFFETKPSTDSQEKDSSNQESKTLYQIASPYIHLLTVDRINLQDAHVSYTVEDAVSPVIYALKDANFKAYNFLLDKNSSISGKLLYCDNFEFIANKPQTLLHSDQIMLNTDNIKLSTLDSIIKIEGIHLSPKNNLWDSRTSRIGAYLKAEIKAVDVKGVYFKREHALNYLEARSFYISSTDIQYFSVKGEEAEEKKNAQERDTTASWSLHKILHPILYSISIDKIGVEQTKLSYTFTRNGYTNTYSLDQFDFDANNFLVDSLSEKQKRFWYVDDFTLTGAGINVLQRSNNSDISVGHLLFSTTDKRISISDIQINPLSINTPKDYMAGHIGVVDVQGLDYASGISAKQIKMGSVNLEYSKKQGTASPRISGKQSMVESISDIFKPFTESLSVDDLRLDDINLIYRNNNSGKEYSIKHLNFYASDFILNKQSLRNSNYFFECSDVSMSFQDFDNFLPENNYRLQIQNADISSLSGKFRLENVRLIPQENTWQKAPDIYYDISTPLIDITGFNNDMYKKNKVVGIQSLIINSPQIRIVKSSTSVKGQKEKATSHAGISCIFSDLRIDTIGINNAGIRYFDKTTKDSLSLALGCLDLNSLKRNKQQDFAVGALIIQSPRVDYNKGTREYKANNNSSEFRELFSILGDKVKIGKLTVHDNQFNISQSNSSYSLGFKLFDMSGLMWNFQNKRSLLDIVSFDLIAPKLSIDNSSKKLKESSKSKKTSEYLYTTLRPFVDQLSIGEVNIKDANINRTHLQNGQSLNASIINTFNLKTKELVVNSASRHVDVEEGWFNTQNVHFPVMDGFYTVDIGDVDISAQKGKGKVKLSDLKMVSSYPKMEFAYKHPKRKDWFDVNFGSIILSDVDYRAYLSGDTLQAKNLKFENVLLQNFKNQQIKGDRNSMPLIYEAIQKSPLKLDIENVDIANFSVIYEELAAKGTKLGKLSFMGMNGRLNGLTNIVSYPNQYMRLDVDGKLMGTGLFNVKWDIPVSEDNDCFLLEAHVDSFDLTSLNQILFPISPMKVRSGILTDFSFITEASSKSAQANMLFLYNDLRVNVYKKLGDESPHKFHTTLANTILRTNNPFRQNITPKEVSFSIERDPYHSTFNYFWQILRPGLVETVGVSKKEQRFIKSASGIVNKIKGIFRKKKKEPKV